MRDYVFINEDGTVYNLLNLVSPEAIAENDDLKDLLYFDYTDWDYDDKPAPSWTYNKETQEWNKVLPFVANVPAMEGVEPADTAELATAKMDGEE
jgi:hypothetical protein